MIAICKSLCQVQDQNEKDIVSALWYHNSIVRRMDLQFIKMFGDPSSIMPTNMILPGGRVSGWRQGKVELKSAVFLALNEE